MIISITRGHFLYFDRKPKPVFRDKVKLHVTIEVIERSVRAETLLMIKIIIIDRNKKGICLKPRILMYSLDDRDFILIDLFLLATNFFV